MKLTTLVLTMLGMLLASGTSAQSGEALLAAKGCLGCHDMSTAKVGPAFKDIAAKYKDDKQAAGNLAARLKQGEGHPVKA